MQSVRQSDTDNAPTTAPVVITPLSYFRKDSVSVLLAQLDGAESRTVFGQTVVVFPNELLNATSEELEDVLQDKAKAILFGTLTVNGVTMTVETAAKWYCNAISNGNKDADKYAKEVYYRPLEEVKATWANHVNFNELNLDGGKKAGLCLVSKEDYAKAEEIQAWFANNGLNLSRGDYLSNGQGTIWTINKFGIILG
jgi:hypothetical protein